MSPKPLSCRPAVSSSPPVPTARRARRGAAARLALGVAAACALVLVSFVPARAAPAQADAPPVLIGFDGEYGHKTSTSPLAIERGIELAIEEINQSGGVLGGRPLRLVTRDNQSITARARDNLRELAEFKDLVAVFGGKFSPTIVESVPVAQDLRIPLVSVWGSADEITDHPARPSYTFRLSLKDEWAAPAMLQHAKEAMKASRACALLPNTAWGRSNEAALQRHAKSSGVELVARRWYNWGDATLLPHYVECLRANAQVVLLIGNEREGALLVQEVARQGESRRMPIVSHWGITGGRFAQMAGEALDDVRIEVIQTFSFVGNRSPQARKLARRYIERFGVEAVENIESPVGVAHAYDMTYLLARAIDRAGGTDRDKVRAALEQLGSHDGVVRRYDRPFTATRHDALDARQVLFVTVRRDGALIPVPASRRGERT